MFLHIIKLSIISFLFILIIHYLYNFFKDNLTIPKTKDLVSKPIEKYEDMENILDNNKELNTIINNNTNINNNINLGTTEISELNNNDINSYNNQNNMKDELKMFFTNLNNI